MIKNPYRLLIAFWLLVGGCSGYCYADITTGRVLRLRGNETSGTSIADSSSLLLTGTWQGSAITTGVAPTKFPGQIAPVFNGTNNYISFADNAAHDFVDSCSFAFWAKTSVGDGTTLALAGKNDAGFSSGWDILMSSGALNGVVRGSATLNHSPGTPDFNDDGEWHHVVETFTYSGGSLTGRYYLDGSLVDTSGTVALTFNVNNDAMHIGARRAALFWNGSLKEVWIFNRALAGSDVLELFNYTEPIPLLNVMRIIR